METIWIDANGTAYHSVEEISDAHLVNIISHLTNTLDANLHISANRWIQDNYRILLRSRLRFFEDALMQRIEKLTIDKPCE